MYRGAGGRAGRAEEEEEEEDEYEEETSAEEEERKGSQGNRSCAGVQRSLHFAPPYHSSVCSSDHTATSCGDGPVRSSSSQSSSSCCCCACVHQRCYGQRILANQLLQHLLPQQGPQQLFQLLVLRLLLGTLVFFFGALLLFFGALDFLVCSPLGLQVHLICLLRFLRQD